MLNQKKEKMEKAKRRGRPPKDEAKDEARKRNIEAYWLEFTKQFRPWLYELTRQYKERGRFPVCAAWTLPSYYTDDKDREMAAFAAMLIRDGEKTERYIADFRRLFDGSPFLWVKSRAFVSLSMRRGLKECVGGVGCERAADYFSRLYDVWWKRESCFSDFLVNFFGEDRGLVRARLLRLVLSRSDGVSIGLWPTTREELKCPLTSDVKTFYRTFFPDYARLCDIDRGISLFGLDCHTDFLYATMAWKELCQTDPSGCSRLATLFQTRYDDGIVLSERYWTGSRAALPEIRF